MKCDYLKYERLGDAFNDYPDSTLVIRKQFVDAAIAELKEVAEDACLERDDNMRVIDEFEDENRRLKRALWLARAESAKNAMCRYYRLAQKEECDPQPHGWSCYINGEVYSTGKMNRKLEPHYWFDVWEEVERKCRSKAKEYK